MKQATDNDFEELSSPPETPKESAMRVMMLHTGHGFKTVVMGDPGRKWTPYVEIEYPVRLRKITNADAVKRPEERREGTKSRRRRGAGQKKEKKKRK